MAPSAATSISRRREQGLRTRDRVLEVATHLTAPRGHSGTPGNERCDEIAVEFTKKNFVHFYKGPLLNYSVAVHDLPVDR